jgi:phage terminase large subunit-like protein
MGEAAEISGDQPRLETVWDDRHGSLEADLGGWSERFLGVPLMPWQARALAGLTALRDDARFQHRMGLVSTARQNGKTHALATLVGYFLTMEPIRRGAPVTVLSTAHRLDVAVELFRKLAELLETQFGAKVTWAYGRNEVKMPDGSRWLVKAASPSVGHGLSVDLVVADEIWDISTDAIDQGLLPTMRARPNPLMAMWSTAGTESSTVFLRYREQGLRLIDSGRQGALYMAEWSPPPDVDPMTPAAWQYGNPALGHTLQMETIEAEAQSPDRAAFLRASVNLWVASDRAWVRPGQWPDLEHTNDVPPGGVIAVESSLDDSRYFGVRAAPTGDGRVVVTVAFHVDTIAQCIDAITAASADPKITFAVSPTIELHMPKALERRYQVVGYGELLRYTPAVKNMIEEKTLRHTGEQMLAEHVQRAVAVRSQGSMALSSQRSPGPIELARCMVWAAALAARPAAAGKPMIVIANN